MKMMHHSKAMNHMKKAEHHHHMAKEHMEKAKMDKHMDMKQDKKMMKGMIKKECMKK